MFLKDQVEAVFEIMTTFLRRTRIFMSKQKLDPGRPSYRQAKNTPRSTLFGTLFFGVHTVEWATFSESELY